LLFTVRNTRAICFFLLHAVQQAAGPSGSPLSFVSHLPIMMSRDAARSNGDDALRYGFTLEIMIIYCVSDSGNLVVYLPA
ncbi:hypothetical protein GOODEAATRI_015236, partial [Goodea atripinnis]